MAIHDMSVPGASSVQVSPMTDEELNALESLCDELVRGTDQTSISAAISEARTKGYGWALAGPTTSLDTGDQKWFREYFKNHVYVAEERRRKGST